MTTQGDETASYHDLHITAPGIDRESIFNLPFKVQVTCCRAAGWQIWDGDRLIGGEYHDGGLLMDVAGHVICDTLAETNGEG